MPISDKHPDYISFINKWQQCRDCYEGQEAIKSKGELYLPRLSSQKNNDIGNKEYNIYKSRATFFGFLSNTISAYSGAAFISNPVIEYGTEKLKSWSDFLYREDIGIIEHIRETFNEILAVGRQIIYIDMNQDGSGQPYLVKRRAEDAINWELDHNGNLISIVFQETFWESDPKDKYKKKSAIQWRELFLDGGKYIQRVFRKEIGGKYIQIGDDIIPKKLGKPLDFIPLVVFNITNFSLSPEKPPLLDATDLNIAHYRNTADYEQILHNLACGTPYIFGIREEELPTAIGPNALWSTKSSDTKAGILEFSGEGVNSLRDAMSDKEDAMVAVGLKMINQKRAGIETAEAARLRSNSEHATLSKVVDTISSGYKKLLSYVAYWLGVENDNITIDMSHDFINDGWNPQELQALTAALLEGGISWDSFYYNLSSKGFFPDEWDSEKEKGSIENGGYGMKLSLPVIETINDDNNDNEVEIYKKEV